MSQQTAKHPVTWVMPDGSRVEQETKPEGAIGLVSNGAEVPRAAFPALFEMLEREHQKAPQAFNNGGAA